MITDFASPSIRGLTEKREILVVCRTFQGGWRVIFLILDALIA